MPEHDHPLDGVAEPRLAQQLAVGDHEVRSEVRSARDLGGERPAALARELLGDGPGAGAGDDERARSVLDHRGAGGADGARGADDPRSAGGAAGPEG